MTLKAHALELLIAIEEETELLIQRAERHASRGRKPPNGGWSMCEVLEHIAIVTESTIRSIPTTPALVTSVPLSLKIFRRIGAIALRTPIKVKAPAATEPKGASFEDVVTRLRAANARLREVFDPSDDEALRRHAFFRHPFFGELSLFEGLKFLRSHLKHHFFQIRRIEREIGEAGPVTQEARMEFPSSPGS